MKKYLNLKDGTSMLGVLIASAIGLVVIGGVTKSLLHNVDQSQKVMQNVALTSIKQNIISILRSQKAWKATVDFADPETSGCFPGGENAGTSCPMNLFYNPNNPDLEVDYINNRKKWVCDVSGEDYGIGLIDFSGSIIFPEDSWSACCNNLSSTSGIANCDLGNLKYVVVTVYPPAGFASGYALPPDFEVSLMDKFYSKKVMKRFKVVSEQAAGVGTSDAIPSGAVMAFNLAICPDGWSEFTQVRGRVVIGAGQGPGLTLRNLGNSGGEESHKLTILEMPKHAHSISAIRGSGGNSKVLSSWGGTTVYEATNPAGGDQPHNNMQPFYTLRYCQKD